MNKEDFFKLTLQGNKEILTIAECLKLCRNEIYGRHIVTTQDLKCGEIIAIEKPFYKSLDKRASPRRCVNCLKSIINPIACFSCKSVLFCSEDCKKSAWTEFHGFECHYIDEMTEDDGFLMMVERSLFKALSISGDLENLQKLVEKNEESAVFESSGNLILACFSLEESEPTEGEIDFAERFVDNHEHVKQLHKTDDQRNFLIGFILNIIGVLNRNSFTLHWSSPESNQEETGCGIFPFSSLINHSCSANVSRVCYEENLVLITKQPIAANQQIFICYH